MTRTRTTRTTANSRRRFLKTLAMGSAAALAATALPPAAEAAKRLTRPKPAEPAPATGKTPGRTPAIETEVAKQKKSTADLLKVIRDYDLPAGSEMAFVFSAVKAPKRRGTPGGTSTSGGSR